MKIIWTEDALSRLEEIEVYISEDNPAAAVHLVEEIIHRTDILINHPHSGRCVPELPHGNLRELIEGNYRIVYRVQRDQVEILSVFESHHCLPREIIS